MQTFGKGKLQETDGIRENSVFRFADEQGMVWHNHISVDRHRKAAAHVLKSFNEEVAGVRRIESALAMIASKGNEVRLTRMLKAFEALRHEKKLQRKRTLGCD